MIEYTQGICQDGAAILANGEMITIEQILEGLRKGEEYKSALAEIAQKTKRNNVTSHVYIQKIIKAVLK